MGSLNLKVNAQNVSANIEHALEGVVTVAVEKTIPIGKVMMGFRGNFMEEAYKRSLDLTGALGSGSGFAINKNGKLYIVTNAHVVESASDEQGSIFVYSYNRKKYEVKVRGGDSFYDIAVLEFIDQPGTELKPLNFEKEIPAIATRVFALGNPLGQFPNTVTDGIVSAVNRSRDGVTGKFGFIQSTATLIWGNSGGPLVNESGKVVGVNSQIQIHSVDEKTTIILQQINFALEAPITERIVNSLVENKKLKRTYLGVEFSQRNQIIKTHQGLALGPLLDELPVLTNTIDGSIAAKTLAAYKGWALTQINNSKIKNLEDALGVFESIPPNTSIDLVFTNGTATKTATVTSEELQPKHLEKLASYSLQQIPNIRLDNNSPQVKIYTSSNEGTKSQQVGYYLVGAGSTSQANLWRITNMADLGALLRVYGPQGGLDYVLIDESNPESEAQKVSYSFSKSENEYTRKLWY